MRGTRTSMMRKTNPKSIESAESVEQAIYLLAKAVDDIGSLSTVSAYDYVEGGTSSGYIENPDPSFSLGMWTLAGIEPPVPIGGTNILVFPDTTGGTNSSATITISGLTIGVEYTMDLIFSNGDYGFSYGFGDINFVTEASWVADAESVQLWFYQDQGAPSRTLTLGGLTFSQGAEAVCVPIIQFFDGTTLVETKTLDGQPYTVQGAVVAMCPGSPLIETDPLYNEDKPNIALKSEVEIKESKTSPRLSSVLTIGRDLSAPVVINSATPVDLTWLFAGGGAAGTVTELNENSPFYYDEVNNLIRCTDETTDAFSFLVFLVLNGSISNGGDSDVFQFSLHRPDDSIFRTRQDGTAQSSTLTSAEIANFNSYINSGGADNFQLPLVGTPTGTPPVYPSGTIGGGFRIKMSRINGNATWTLSAANQQIRILS